MSKVQADAKSCARRSLPPKLLNQKRATEREDVRLDPGHVEEGVKRDRKEGPGGKQRLSEDPEEH